MEQVQQVTEEDLAEVLQGILDRPLYTEFKYQGADNVNALPSRVKHFCPHCDKELNWDLIKGGEWVPDPKSPPAVVGMGTSSGRPRGFQQWKNQGLTHAEYKCKNCEYSTVVVYINWFTESSMKEMKEDLAHALAGTTPSKRNPKTSVFMKVG